MTMVTMMVLEMIHMEGNNNNSRKEQVEASATGKEKKRKVAILRAIML